MEPTPRRDEFSQLNSIAMTMPSTRQRQFSDFVASHPSFSGRTTSDVDEATSPKLSKEKPSSVPNSTELLHNTTKLLNDFERLHNVERVPLGDKRITSIRVKMEKAMPHIYRLTSKRGPPYPTPKFLSLKSHAEECLRKFDVDLDALQPKVSVTKTTPSFSNASNLTSGGPNQSKSVTTNGTTALPPRLPTQMQHVRPTLDVTAEDARARGQATLPFVELGLLTSSNSVESQKALLCAVHDVVDKMSFSSRHENNDGYWLQPPASLSPDEIQSSHHSGGDGGNNGMSGGMKVNDIRGPLNPAFGSFAQHRYMQSVTSGHGVAGTGFPQHLNMERNVGNGHAINDAHQSNV